MRAFFENQWLKVYRARWEDVHAAGLLPVDDIALVHADPPYGQRERFNQRARGRGREAGGNVGRVVGGRGRPKAHDWPRIEGDDQPFDPAPLLALNRRLVTWGAQRYADKLPPSPSWIWWGKKAGTPPDDNGDGELAWTNLGGPPREFQHLWRGTCRASETGVPHLGPAQKPVALSRFVFSRARLQRGDLVFVPYLGTGPDITAAEAAGLRVIACDVSEAAIRGALEARLLPLFRQAPGPVVSIG